MNLYGQRWLKNTGSAQAEMNGHTITIERDTSRELRNSNAEFSMSLSVGRFHELPKRSGSIAIIAGGPSLKSSMKQIKALTCPIIACGSAHDHLRSQGVPLAYAVVYDPLPVQADYFRHPHPACTYIVSSTCDPAVFDALQDSHVRLWHPAGEVDDDILGDELRFIVGGGATVTLRAIPLAVIMGYTDIHLYGFDSSFEKEHHAYELMDSDPGIGDPIDVSIHGKHFITTVPLLAQAQQFMQIKDRFPGYTCTVHGDGMIAEMMRA